MSDQKPEKIVVLGGTGFSVSICKKCQSLVDSRFLYEVMASYIAAVSKYHITDRDSWINLGRHLLVVAAKKAFMQQRPPLPRYPCLSG